ncbi:MAG: hypothetical protein IPP90_16335 [Gemmatimonadaceae bacterium]|nr:hypothetical protein [Gemmatimonadaceae bacterium]
MAIRRYSSVLIASLFVAAIATYLVFRYINASTASNQIATRPVVVAAKDIAEGAEIQEADVRVAQWPEPRFPRTRSRPRAGERTRVTCGHLCGEAIVPVGWLPKARRQGWKARSLRRGRWGAYQ